MKEITITLKQIEEAINSYNEQLISSSLEEYLSFQMHLCEKETVTLKISGLKKKSDQKKIETILHQYYKKKMEVLLKKDKYKDQKRIFLLLLGILLIFISSFFSFILSEIILVAGWVAIWEMVNDLLFREKARRKEIQIAKILSVSKIVFE